MTWQNPASLIASLKQFGLAKVAYYLLRALVLVLVFCESVHKIYAVTMELSEAGGLMSSKLQDDINYICIMNPWVKRPS